ncbi:hypothetical protein FQR65_LT02768 [Abscondita terminalis]|nr:hypothetical protein FQR65_LT02768 [Abscondita terminalis]
MSEITTTTCRISLNEIKQELELDDALELKPELPELHSEKDLSITTNLVMYNKSDAHNLDYQSCPELYPLLVKEEIKEEYCEDTIKTEQIIDDDCLLFNTDIPLCNEERFLVTVLYYCDRCTYSTNDKNNLADHIFTHRFRCNQCNYTTPDNDILIDHKQLHFMIGSLQCNSCNYTCLEKHSLDEHMSTHITLQNDVNEKSYQPVPQGWFKCYYCGYKTINKITWKFHVKTHKKIGDFLCAMCTFKAHSKDNLNNHMLTMHKRMPTHHRKEDLNFKCSLCDFCTKRWIILKEHLNIHFFSFKLTEKKPFECNLCNFRYKSLKSLKGHLRLAHGKVFSCNECSYKTYGKLRFQSHTISHSKKKSFNLV